MGRLVAISSMPYRGHDLELRDSGRGRHTVIIHPPAHRGGPVEVSGGGAPMTLAEMVSRAKEIIDSVLGPRPAPRIQGTAAR